MSHLEDKIKSQVKGLRVVLAKTQTEIATLIGRTLITVQRYESTGQVPIAVLGAYCRIAIEAGLTEQAEGLRAVLLEQIGQDALDAIHWEPGNRRNKVKAIIPDSLRPVIEEFADLLQNPQGETERAESRWLAMKQGRGSARTARPRFDC